MIVEGYFYNFQAHKKQVIKFDPYITTLTGATDKGKSSVLRGFRWNILNKIKNSGKNRFIRDENKPAIVGIKTDKGRCIRKKGKGENSYIINGKKYEAFGQGVPDEVQKFLNIRELNFQFQFDAPYWFMISDSEVSKQLNKIVDLSIIDSSLSILSHNVKVNKTKVKVGQERLDDIDAKLDKLSFVDDMSNDYSKLQQTEQQIQQNATELECLTKSIQDIKRYVKRKKSLENVRQACDRAINAAEEHSKATQDVALLVKIINEVEELQQIARITVPDIAPLEKIETRYKQVQEDMNLLSDCIADIESEEERICVLEKELHANERKLKKTIGQTCPLCGK